MLRRIARSAASSAPASWLVTMLERLDSGRADVLAVLMYHHIAEPARAGAHAGLWVSPTSFVEHVEALARRYTFISAQDLLVARRGGQRLPPHSLLLTFDDGNADFGTTAWPILRERSIPAVLFVPTSYPDASDRWLWWDRLGDVLSGAAPRRNLPTPLGDMPFTTLGERDHAYRRLRDYCKLSGIDASIAMIEKIAADVGAGPPRNEVLGWDALRALAREGVALAPHSRSHALLTTLHDSELKDELTGSRDDLERELRQVVNMFSYPSGDHDDRVVTATELAGYEVAFTTRRGVNDLRRAEWLTLHRINVGQGANPTRLRAQVGRWMALVDR